MAILRILSIEGRLSRGGEPRTLRETTAESNGSETGMKNQVPRIFAIEEFRSATVRADPIAPAEQVASSYKPFSSIFKIACIKTLAPFATSEGVVNSFGEWLIPPTLGTKIIPIGTIRARF